MSKHISYRGVYMDMDSFRRENESTPSVGNVRTNARGDLLNSHGLVTKTAEEMARENHRIKTVEINSGLKPSIDQSDVQPANQERTVKERVLPSKDIVIGE